MFSIFPVVYFFIFYCLDSAFTIGIGTRIIADGFISLLWYVLYRMVSERLEYRVHGVEKVFSFVGPSPVSSAPPVELRKVRLLPVTTISADLAIATARIRFGRHVNIAFPWLGDTIKALRGLFTRVFMSSNRFC